MAFQTALSGLNAAASNLNVTGNNIANASTTGFKKSRAEFADVYAVSFGGVANTATGAGVRLTDVSQQFTQGNIDFTSNNLDLAISGEGFFVLNDNGSPLYTRSGNFRMDRNGFVVNANGQRLQVNDVNANGQVTNFTSHDLQLNLGANPASATTRIDVNMNLNPGTAAIDAVAYPALNINDSNTYNFSTTTTIYDSLGVTHQATLYFRKDTTMPANQWSSTLVVTDNNGTATQFDTQTLNFNQNGSLATTGDIDFLAGSGPFTPSTGAANLGALNINFGGSTQQGGTNSAVSNINQDGFTTGTLSGISVDASGVVFARYTNGQTDNLGAVALARFSNPNGLQQTGDTNWAATFEAGDVQMGQGGTGTFGQIQSGALESSNVDISQQLVNMIIAQRDYQANAKMISTEDNITQTIINIR